MLPELEAWLDFYYYLSTPLIKETGASAEALKLADVWDDASIDILAELDLMRLRKEREDLEAERKQHGR